MRTIELFMTRAPVTIDLDDSLREALRRMQQHSVRHLPVHDRSRPVDPPPLAGVISEVGILLLAARRPGSALEEIPVRDAVDAPFTVAPDTPARVVARAMIERGIHAAVVTDAGRVVGIFTGQDALRAFAEGDAAGGPRTPRWPQRLLCPIDFSAGSREAVRIAIELAAGSGGSVTLFHAYDLPLSAASEGAMLGAAALEHLDRDTDAGLRAWQAELSRPGGPPIAVAKGLGTASETIAGHARAHDFDVVVLGTHGRTGLKRAVLGSVAESVARHAPCPVLIVRRGEKA